MKSDRDVINNELRKEKEEESCQIDLEGLQKTTETSAGMA
jgi:hypothetical protein